jgi:hypothetical protein
MDIHSGLRLIMSIQISLAYTVESEAIVDFKFDGNVPMLLSSEHLELHMVYPWDIHIGMGAS